MTSGKLYLIASKSKKINLVDSMEEREATSSFPRKRLVWIDVLNICACAGVLLLHCTNYAIWNYSGKVSLDFCFSVICQGFVLWPVNVFFMITGYTLIKKTNHPLDSLKKDNFHKFYHRRLRRLLIPVLVWNIYYSVLLYRKLYSEGTFYLQEFIVKFLQFESNGFMWFFIPLIGIYLVLPYFSVLCNTLSRSQLRNLIFLSFACICIPSSISSWIGLTKYDNLFPITGGYLIYTAIGYYIGNYGIPYRIRRLIYIAGLVSCIVLSLEHFFGKVYFENYKVSYLGICCTLSAISFFTLIRNVDFDKYLGGGRLGICIDVWSSLSLGIYLIQMTLLSLINKISFIDCGLIRFLCLYPICVVCVYFIKRIPYIRRIV